MKNLINQGIEEQPIITSQNQGEGENTMYYNNQKVTKKINNDNSIQRKIIFYFLKHMQGNPHKKAWPLSSGRRTCKYHERLTA